MIPARKKARSSSVILGSILASGTVSIDITGERATRQKIVENAQMEEPEKPDQIITQTSNPRLSKKCLIYRFPVNVWS